MFQPNAIFNTSDNHPMHGRIGLLVEHAEQLWREFNRCGELDPYGSPNDDVNEIKGIGQLVWRAFPEMQPYAIYWDDSTNAYHVVANANGPCGMRFDHL